MRKIIGAVLLALTITSCSQSGIDPHTEAACNSLLYDVQNGAQTYPLDKRSTAAQQFNYNVRGSANAMITDAGAVLTRSVPNDNGSWKIALGTAWTRCEDAGWTNG